MTQSSIKLKLTLLLQHCSGPALSLIEDCVMLPPKQGYVQALKKLEKRFGKNHLIARSYIDSVKNGKKISLDDISALCSSRTIWRNVKLFCPNFISPAISIQQERLSASSNVFLTVFKRSGLANQTKSSTLAVNQTSKTWLNLLRSVPRSSAPSMVNRMLNTRSRVREQSHSNSHRRQTRRRTSV